MTLPENLPQLQGAHWRTLLQQLIEAGNLPAGTPLVGVYGKASKVDGWSEPDFATPATDLLTDPATDRPTDFTGVGWKTGPQPQWPGSGLICFDFDGASTIAAAIAAGCDPTTVDTWKVQRIDGQGQLVTDRMKVLFTTSTEQQAQLVDAHYHLPSTTADGITENLEVFHHTGRQVVVLGGYRKKGTPKLVPGTVAEGLPGVAAPVWPDGAYVWAKGCGLVNLQPLPDDWMALALVAQAASTTAARALRRNAQAATGKAKTGRATDWRDSGPHRPCPICGRDSSGACLEHRESGSVWCYHGQTFTPNSLQGFAARKVGDLFPGRNGTTYGFVRDELFPNWGAAHTLFVVHDPTRRRDGGQGTVPGPIDLNDPALGGTGAAPTAGLLADLQRHPDPAERMEPPASSAVIEVQAVDLAAPTHHHQAIGCAELLRADWRAGRFDGTEAGLRLLTDRLRHLADLCARATVDGLHGIKGEATAILRDTDTDGGDETPAVVGGKGSRVPVNTWSDFLREAEISARQARNEQRSTTRLATNSAARQRLQERWGGELPPEGHETQALIPWLPNATPLAGGQRTSHTKREIGQAWDALVEALGPRAIRTNLLTNRIELHQPGLPPLVFTHEAVATIYLQWQRAGFEDPGKEYTADLLMEQARANTYSPFVDFLKDVLNDHTIEPIAPDTIAGRFLGVDDELSAASVAGFLRATVARAMFPGCRVREILVLQGPEHCGKSRWFRSLMPPHGRASNWVIDSVADATDAKSIMEKTQHCVLYELAELDQVTGRKGTASALKNLFSSNTDTYRAAYAKAVEQHPRRMMFVGTLNPGDFLQGTEENTRYLIVQVGKGERIEGLHDAWAGGIDLHATEQHHRAIWKGALLDVLAARETAGGSIEHAAHAWHLPHHLRDQQRLRAQAFAITGGSADRVEAWIDGLPSTPGVAFTLGAVHINASVQGPFDRVKGEITTQLRKLGITETRMQLKGARRSLWHRQGEGHLITEATLIRAATPEQLNDRNPNRYPMGSPWAR